jgi:hypothetical protein
MAKPKQELLLSNTDLEYVRSGEVKGATDFALTVGNVLGLGNLATTGGESAGAQQQQQG